MPSLTQSEAHARAELIEPHDCSVQLDLRAAADQSLGFWCTTRLRFHARSAAHTFVDVRAERLSWATVNETALSAGELEQAARVGRLPVTVQAGLNEVTIRAWMAYSRDGEGMVRFVDPADQQVYVYAMSFLSAAPRWFACFDQPDLKSPLQLQLRCPPAWTVWGNAPAQQLAPGVWRLQQPLPVASYATTVVAGPWASHHLEVNGVQLGLHARASLREPLDLAAADLLAHTARCLRRCEELFAHDYPWGQYHQVFVPVFAPSAMENPGCVTLRDDLLFRSPATDSQVLRRQVLIAHEMAHMWFGNLVTMRWWDDLWLNESFAEYLGHRICADEQPEQVWGLFGIQRKAWGQAADRRPSTHPVAPGSTLDAEAALTEFDGISYAKGAALLRQLSGRIGEDAFLAGIRYYIARFAGANATLHDLLDAWRRAGFADIDHWAKHWLTTAGCDVLQVQGPSSLQSGGTIRVLTEGASGDWMSAGGREHAMTALLVDDVGAVLAQENVTVDATGTHVFTDHPGARSAALILPDADDQTWATLRLESGAWQRMATILPGLALPTRVSTWNALRLGVADALVDPWLALQVIGEALPLESSDAVVAELLTWAEGLVGTAAAPSAVQRVHALARRVLDQTAPAGGSASSTSRYRTALRTVIGTAPGGSGIPVDLATEADLEIRWLAVRRLLQLPTDARSAESHRQLLARLAVLDPSVQGRREAVRARAGRPTAAAKEQAWQLIGSAARDPELAGAAARGFWVADQQELTAPYVVRYFAEINRICRTVAGWAGARVADLAFPRLSVDDDTVQRARHCLQHQDLPAGVRRVIADRTDDLERAWRSRQRFATPRSRTDLQFADRLADEAGRRGQANEPGG